IGAIRWDHPWGQPRQPPQSQARKVYSVLLSPPLPKWCQGRIPPSRHPLPLRNKGPELGADNLTLEGVATELAPSDFVSQNYETLVALMQEETKKRSRHQKERRGKDSRRPPVFGRIGKKVSGTQTANLQNLDTHENNDWRISVRDRLGSRDVHSRLGQRRSPSESPPSSDSEDSRRKRRRRVSSSSEDSSDNEDAETGHWKSAILALAAGTTGCNANGM
ncbi:hypothetical protein Tco_0043010, partial [Tanacetum coccineum]